MLTLHDPGGTAGRGGTTRRGFLRLGALTLGGLTLGDVLRLREESPVPGRPQYVLDDREPVAALL